MRKSAQPSIYAYIASICVHPDISFSYYYSDTGISIRCHARPIFYEADRCHIPCQQQSFSDFFWDDHLPVWAPRSSQWSVRATSSHSARPNRDEHREGLPGHRPPPSTSYPFRVWSFQHKCPFFCRGKAAVSKGFFPFKLALFVQF